MAVEQSTADNDNMCDIDNTTQEPISMDMECEMASSTTQETMGDTNHSDIPCLSSSVPNDDDDFRRASNTLKTITRENGFIVHDVPYDGDCLFSAIVYQLKSIGLHSGDKNELRKMVADHLDANSAFYCNYVSQSLASHDAYNADTEAPNAEDAYIATLDDPQQRVQVYWEK